MEEVNVLRRKCRDGGVTYRVIKNTLAKLAVAGTDKEALADSFVGPTAAAWTMDDPVAPAKVLVDVAKDFAPFELKDAVVEGKALTAAQVEQLAKLPSRDALRGQLLSVLIAPMQQLTSVISAPARDIVGVIDAYTSKENEDDNA